jgi:hypothetical protein
MFCISENNKKYPALLPAFGHNSALQLRLAWRCERVEQKAQRK